MDDENDDEKQPSIYEEDSEQDKGLFRWMNAFVVLLAVAGFFGLAWYAYKGGDTVVDENQVELVKADTAPIKEAPANPGGMQIPNQDKTVYSLINGAKAEKPVAERILPAPEEPIARSGDTESWMSDKVKNKDSADAADTQGTQVQTAQNVAPAVTAAPEAPAAPTPPAPQKAAQFNPAKIRKEEATVKAEDQTKQPAAPVASVTTADTLPTVQSNASDTVPASIPVPVSKAAPVVPAPTAAKPVSATPAKVAKNDDDDDDDKGDGDAKKPVAKTVPAPAAKPAKGVRAQLGAYKSEAEAKSQWAKISSKFSDDLQGKQYVIARADLGSKGVFYRLQVAPFTNASQAEQFCLSFVSAGQGCFSVNVK